MFAIFTPSNVLIALCVANKKCGIYFSGTKAFDCIDYEKKIEQIIESAAWLKNISHENQVDYFLHGSGYLMFDTPEEMWNVFNQTKGSDCENNSIPRVFMLTCDANGVLQSDNS